MVNGLKFEIIWVLKSDDLDSYAWCVPRCSGSYNHRFGGSSTAARLQVLQLHFRLDPALAGPGSRF